MKKAKYNILLSLGAAVAMILVTGNLGLGQFLNNQIAFGYGGSLVINPAAAINNPLVVSGIFKEGRLFRHFTDALIEVEVPPLAVSEYAIFDVKEVAISAGNNVCSGSGQIIGGKAFTIFAKDINEQPINIFNRNLNVSITVPGLPVNTANLGVYYLNSNNQWVFGAQAIFNIQDSKVTFKVNEIGTFAIINTNGLPSLIEGDARCRGQVLGVKEFANGSVLRTCDAQMYVIENSIAKSIGRLTLMNRTYQGQPVNDVDYDIIVRYTPDGSGPIRKKDFSAGDLLRTCDYKVYRIEMDQFRHVLTLRELRERFEGQVINNVDYWQIAKYRNLGYTPAVDQEVLGVKKFAPGALIRTSDNKVYIIEASTVKHLVTLDTTQNFFAGQEIHNVSFEVLNEYRNPAIASDVQRVLGIKRFGEGALLRTRDWSVYRIENGQAKKITTISNTGQNTFQGQKINDVDYGELAFYSGTKDSLIKAPTQQVLGVKQYGEGTLLRTPDRRVYVIRNKTPQHIATLQDLSAYAGVTIISITQAEFEQLLNGAGQVTTGGQVLGIKKYGDGTLLKTSDWKLYEVKNGSVYHIATVPGAQDYYEGRKIVNVSFEELAQYGRN